MKREIRFRAWDKLEKKMIEPQDFSEAIVIQLGGVIGLFNGSKYDTATDRFTLLRYSGLKDISGAKIFEGHFYREEIDLGDNGSEEVVYTICWFIDEWGKFAWLSEREFEIYISEEFKEFEAYCEKYGHDKGDFTMEGAVEVQVVGNVFQHQHKLALLEWIDFNNVFEELKEKENG